MSPDSLIAELGEKLALSLMFDEEQRCKILCDGKFSIQMEFQSMKEALVMVAFVGPLPQGILGQEVLKNALKWNHHCHIELPTFAWMEKTDFLVLFFSLKCDELDGEKLFTYFLSLKEKALLWNEAISQGLSSPSGF